MAQQHGAAVPNGLAVDRELGSAERSDGQDGTPESSTDGLAVSLLRPYDAEAPPEPDVERLLRKMKHRNPRADLVLVRRAYEVASEKHTGQVRKSGLPFVAHPLGVAMIVADLGLDATSIIAALLHDVVEDTSMTLAEVEAQFGPEVAKITDGLTKLDRIGFETREAAQAETIRKMVIAMARDIRVLLIKLADRLNNMRDVGYLPREKQERKARETLEIYAPLANRLGMHQVKWELEDLAFAALYPKRYEEIVRMTTERQPEREKYLATVIGQVHALWKPVPGRFKDYIAMPKFNLYQSLHTTVVGPEGKPLEIQIRTKSM